MGLAIAATLYERLGGHTAIETLVEEFYGRVLSDPQLKRYFAKTDMNRQRQHQVRFLSMALGGPAPSSGQSTGGPHEQLAMTGEHLNRLAVQLANTLRWAGVGQDGIDEVLTTIERENGSSQKTTPDPFSLD